MQALRDWIPTLEEKGFELVSVSKLLQQPKTIIVEDNHHADGLSDVKPAAAGNPITWNDETTTIPSLEFTGPAPDQWHSLQLE